MGAWGYGILENDIALDVDERIETLMKKGLSLVDSVDNILSNKYNRICADCVLTIGEIELDRLGYVAHKKEVKEILLRELTPARLKRWGKNLEMRKETLLAFGRNSKLL